MTRFARIVAGVDGHEGGADALALAGLLQSAGGGELIALHVYPFDRSVSLDRAEEFEAGLRDELFPPAWRHRSTRRGSTRGHRRRRRLRGARAARRRRARGRRPRRGGRVASRTSLPDPARRHLRGDAARTPCAVAVAPRGYADHPRPLQRIGVGFDGSEESRAALVPRRPATAATGAVLRVWTIVAPPAPAWPVAAYADWPDYEAAAIRAGNRMLAAARAELGEDTDAEVVIGDAGAELADRTRDTDLLVLGSRSYGPVRRVLLGSTSTRVVGAATGPVLVLPRARVHRWRPRAAGAHRGLLTGPAPMAERLTRWLPPALAVAIAAGGAAHLLGAPVAGDAVWAAAIAVALVPLSADVARSLWHGDVGVDAIALLAMAGALALGELLAGAVVALMLSGGSALEARASRRARRELTALLRRTPRIAHLRRDGRPGGGGRRGRPRRRRRGARRRGDPGRRARGVGARRARRGDAHRRGDPRRPRARGRVRSGASNAGETFELEATRPASQSAFAAIVRLVEEAQAQRAPFTRMADRYAAFLLPVTLVLAAGSWAVSGDAVRALAVLVVATPCPLILAAPIALVSGISRAARLGVVVKGAPAIEGLGRIRTVLLDKTGTLTLGAPAVERVLPADGVAAPTCCAWRRRSTSSRRTSWPRRSSTTRRAVAWCSPTPATCTSSPATGSRASSRGGG